MSLIEKLLEADLQGVALEWSHAELLVDAYKDSLKDIRAELQKIWQKHHDGTAMKVDELVQHNRLRNIEKQILKGMGKLGEKVQGITSKALTEGYTQSYLRTGWGVESYTGVDMKFGMVNERQVEAALKQPLKIDWKKSNVAVVKKLNAELKNTVVKGLIQGMSYGKMNVLATERLNIAANRSMRILRTEFHKAQTAGRVDGLDFTEKAAGSLGLTMKRLWSAASDARVRDSHREMQGVEADAEGFFHLPSGAMTRAPGHSGVAEEDINCRCSVVAEFPELEDGPAEFEPGDKIQGSNLYCMLP